MPPGRPVLGFIFILIGGIFVLLSSLFFLVAGGFLGFLAPVGVLCGTIILVSAVFVYRRPLQHVAWGTMAIVFGCASVVNLGGFLVGMTLAVIGGAIAVSWQPGGSRGGLPAGPYGVPVAPYRMCMGCGRWIPWAYNICPLCGTAAPVAAWAPREGQPPSVPPPVFAPTPPAVTAPCPTCAANAEWVPMAAQWYCPAERRYF